MCEDRAEISGVPKNVLPGGGGSQLIYERRCPSDIFGLNPFSESDIFGSTKILQAN